MMNPWRPPPKLSLSEWADSTRYLPKESAAEPGKWRTSRTEYAREPMNCVSDVRVSDIVIMSAAQMLKTELLLNAIGYYSQHDPGPIMMLQPTIEMGEAVSNDRIAPMIRDTPALWPIFGDPKTKTTGNKILHKQFPGGHLTIAGANSPASLASRPIRVLLCDEPDRYPESAGDEGDPIDLADQRTTTFWNRKVLLTSTPTIKGESRIETAFEETDKRFYHIPCPKCGAFHRLVWENVRWGPETPADGDPKKAMMQCPHCEGYFNDVEKNVAVKLGVWVATAPFTGKVGFQISQLYSPWANRSVPKIVEMFLKAKGNPQRMKVWTNTVLGEVYEIDGVRVSDAELEARAEAFPEKNGKPLLPSRVLLLTVGADTQPDRIEAELIGWGAGEESWSIDYGIFHGDPDLKEGEAGNPWDAFNDWRRKRRLSERGFFLDVSHVCIDTGGSNTQAVYQYVKRHRSERVFGIKGMAGPDKPVVGTPARKRSGKKIQRPIDLYPVGVDQAKHTVMNRLKIDTAGPGYCHFPKGRETEFYRQITAEKLVIATVKGRKKIEWQLPDGRRNEALDCRVYGYAAMILAAPQFDKISYRLRMQASALAGEKLAKILKPGEEPEEFAEPEESEIDDGENEESATIAADPEPEKDNSSRKSKRRRGGGFVNRW